MRTTIELPDELLKRAKVAAIERSTTLKELVIKSLERELITDTDQTTQPDPLRLPIIPRSGRTTYVLPSDELDRLMTLQETEWHGLPG